MMRTHRVKVLEVEHSSTELPNGTEVDFGRDPKNSCLDGKAVYGRKRTERENCGGRLFGKPSMEKPKSLKKPTYVNVPECLKLFYTMLVWC